MNRFALLLLGVACLCGIGTAQVEVPANCPTISVTGPAGIWMPGETIWFVVELKGDHPQGVGFQWTVDRGKIFQGQSTKRIGVRSPKGFDPTIKATVTIKGLAESCPAIAAETASFVIDPAPILLSEFSIENGQINRKRLDQLAIHLKKNRHSYGYIIEYFVPKTPQRVIDKKIELISVSLKTKGIAANEFRVVISEAVRERTNVYAIPPGVDFPAP